MKKLLVMAFMLVLASASTALAVSPTILTNHSVAVGSVGPGAFNDAVAGPITIGSTPFSVSTNVTLIAQGNAGGYNVASKHLSGDVIYVSSSQSASIEEQTNTAISKKGVPLTALVVSTTAGAFYTGAGGY